MEMGIFTTEVDLCQIDAHAVNLVVCTHFALMEIQGDT